MVSRIQNSLNTLDKDMFIPRRYILSVFKSKAEFFILQKMNEKKLFNSEDLFTWLECVPMERVSKASCNIPGIEQCETIMRSREKLPNILETDYGYAVLEATNIDYSKEFKLKTPTHLRRMSKGRYYSKFKGKYIYIIDGYLYAPDTDIKMFNLYVVSFDEKFDDCSSCKDEKTKCESYWDKKLKVPKKLYEVIMQETLREISMRIGIPKDENPNMDSNQKTQTVQ